MPYDEGLRETNDNHQIEVKMSSSNDVELEWQLYLNSSSDIFVECICIYQINSTLILLIRLWFIIDGHYKDALHRRNVRNYHNIETYKIILGQSRPHVIILCTKTWSKMPHCLFRLSTHFMKIDMTCKVWESFVNYRWWW